MRRAVESLEPRVMFAATTVFADTFEGGFLTGWTNRVTGANASTRWGVNSVRAAAGAQSAFASALAGGVTAAQGYFNNQQNTLVRENLSLAGHVVASLSFDYFLNCEAGYDTFSVAVYDAAAGTRTTVFSESGNFSLAGFRRKTIDLSAFAGRGDLDIEFCFETDSSVTMEGGGVWIDDVELVADTVIQPGSISGKVFDDGNNNKRRDTSEAGLANWTVFLDQNRNGVRDAAEPSEFTDANGNYSFTNLAPGTYHVAEQVPSGFTQTSPGPGGASSGSAFEIDVVFQDNSLTIGQRGVFADAASRWEQIIVGDIPDVSENGLLIDDLRITASAPSIDGRGGILGQAAATGFRAGSSLPFQGFMEFDAEDLAQLEADGQLMRVILHEMGHVLGFGTIWDARGLVQGAGGGDPRYMGASATAQYNAIFGSSGSSVPVESEGGPGTADAHWRETSLANELMTGYLNAGNNPLSTITVGAMADLGYAVSYSAADPYSRSAALYRSLEAGPLPYLGERKGGAMSLKAVKNLKYYGEMLDPPPAAVQGSSLRTAPAVAAKIEDAPLLPFAHTVFVETGVARTGVDFGNQRLNQPPVLTGLTDSPDPVTAGANITLTASGASDPDGNVTKVSFYRESNGTAGLQSGTGGDTLVATDATPADGFKVVVSTSGLAAALYTYYAQATDNAGATSSSGTAAPTRTSSVKPPTTGSIAGTVFRDTNGNGVRDSGESGLSGWRVYIDANKNAKLDSGEKNVVTPAGGAYSFTGLSAGTYNVREIDQSGWTRTAASPVVTLTADTGATGKNFANFQNASITGRVFNDKDRDGTQDSGESGLSGVRVYDDKNGNGRYDSGERSATTNSSGNYTLGSLAAAQRTIRIVMPSRRTMTSPSTGYHRLTPSSGQAVTGRNFGTRTVSSLVEDVLMDEL